MRNIPNPLKVHVQDIDAISVSMRNPDSVKMVLPNAISTGSTSDYNKLINKPDINDVTLQGHVTLEDIDAMARSAYDSDSEVASAGGIPDYVEAHSTQLSYNSDTEEITIYHN